MVSGFVPEQYAVYLCQLDPTVGVEMRKIRPCVIVSPEQMHRVLKTVIVAPMTTTITNFPTRVRTSFAGRVGEIALDQLRALDHIRFIKRLGNLDGSTIARLKRALEVLFS